MGTAKLLIEYLRKLLPLGRAMIKYEDIRLDVETKHLTCSAHGLRDHTMTQCKQLVEIAAVDIPKNVDYRFSINYLFYSPRYSSRIMINAQTNELAHVNSMTSLFQSANWLEREVWDLFGIFFVGHNDLRRILTDYNFQGHPLRKDFPLTGFTSLMFSDLKNRIIYSKTKLTQELRVFTLHQNSVRFMSYKTNPKANRYSISLGTIQNMANNLNTYTVKFKAFLLAYLTTQAFLKSKKIALLKLWYLKSYVIFTPRDNAVTGRRIIVPHIQGNKRRKRKITVFFLRKKSLYRREKVNAGKVRVIYKGQPINTYYSSVKNANNVTFAYNFSKFYAF